jgi:hypothetical protein
MNAEEKEAQREAIWAGYWVAKQAPGLYVVGKGSGSGIVIFPGAAMPRKEAVRKMISLYYLRW